MSATKNGTNGELKHYIKNNKKVIDQRSEQSDEETDITIDNKLPIDKFIIKKISTTLNDLIEQNEKEDLKSKAVLENTNKSPFFHIKVPKISIEDYLYRIKRYTDIEDSTFIISLIYIDKLANKQKMILSKFNIFRILFTAIFIAIKYNEDNTFNNALYSKIAGVKIKELNKLEYVFLKLIDFQLHVNEKIYELYFTNLKNSDE